MNTNSLSAGNNHAVIILAAGYSSRMKIGIKALLPFSSDEAMICAPIKACLQNGLCDIFIVVGHEKDIISQAIMDKYHEQIQNKSLNITFVENKNFADGMFSSVQSGFNALLSSNKHFQAAFLIPVDAALIHTSTIKSMSLAFDKSLKESVIIPTFENVEGHPPLIGKEHFANICKYSGENGLRGYFETVAGLVRLPLADEGILSDIDNEDEYSNALKFLSFTKNRELLSIKECLALMHKEELAEKTIKHSLCVGLGAFRLALKLDIVDLIPQFSLVGGLLHDIKKKEFEHPKAGEKLLFSMGYDSLACPIASHMDLPKSIFSELSIESSDLCCFTSLINESHLEDISCFYGCLCVYIADRFFAGNKPVTVEERAARVAQRFQDDGDALKALEDRTKAVLRVIDWFEKKHNCKVEEVVNTASPHEFEKECFAVFVNYL